MIRLSLQSQLSIFTYVNIPSSYPGFCRPRGSFGVIGLKDTSTSSPSTRQPWHARSAPRYSRWRLWFYSHGRLLPYTFIWTSKTNDALLRNCRLTLSWKVRVPSCSLPDEWASLLTWNEPGQYRALEWHEGEQKYRENPRMGVLVEVTVCTPRPLSLPAEPRSRTKNSSFFFFLAFGDGHFVGDEPRYFASKHAWTSNRSVHLHLSRFRRPHDLPFAFLRRFGLVLALLSHPNGFRHRNR